MPISCLLSACPQGLEVAIACKWSVGRQSARTMHICRVGQNCIYTPYMTVYLVISLPKIPYIHRIYMVLANPTYMVYTWSVQERNLESYSLITVHVNKFGHPHL